MVSNFKCDHMHTILFYLLICAMIRVLIDELIDFCIVIGIHTSEDLLLWMFSLIKLFTRHRMDKYKTFFVVLTLLKSFSNKVRQIISFHGWIFYRRELLFHWNKFFELACFSFVCFTFIRFSFVCFTFICVESFRRVESFRHIKIFKDDML